MFRPAQQVPFPPPQMRAVPAMRMEVEHAQGQLKHRAARQVHHRQQGRFLRPKRGYGKPARRPDRSTMRSHHVSCDRIGHRPDRMYATRPRCVPAGEREARLRDREAINTPADRR